MLNGGFPNYKLNVSDIIDLDIGELNSIVDKDSNGVFIPPFGMGWVNIFLEAKGTVLKKRFDGTAHLQKVVGITTFGPFHWGRVVFQEGSSISFFCLKTGKNSNGYFHKSIDFYDSKNKKTIVFDNPKLEIKKKKGGKQWIVEGSDGEKKVKIVLMRYAKKLYTIKGGGSQVYIQYAVIAEEFDLKAEGSAISLGDLGNGIGTLEDAYGSPI